MIDTSESVKASLASSSTPAAAYVRPRVFSPPLGFPLVLFASLEGIGRSIAGDPRHTMVPSFPHVSSGVPRAPPGPPTNGGLHDPPVHIRIRLHGPPRQGRRPDLGRCPRRDARRRPVLPRGLRDPLLHRPRRRRR